MKDECGFGSKCVKFDDQPFQCVKYAGLKVGTEIKQDYEFELRQVCESFNLKQIGGKVYCMPGDQSEIEPLGRAGSETTEGCKYYSFEDPKDLTKKIDKIEYSKCGFNQDGLFYCPMH